MGDASRFLSDGVGHRDLKVNQVSAIEADVLAPKKIVKANGVLVTGTIPSKNAQTYIPNTANQKIDAGQYLTGDQTIAGDPDLIAANIKFSKDIFGVLGNCKAVKSFKVVNGDTTVAALGVDPNYSIALPIGFPIGVTTGTSGGNYKVGNLAVGGSTSGTYPQLIIEFDPLMIKSKQQGTVSVASSVTITAVTPANCLVLCFGTTLNRTSSQAQYVYFYASLADGTTLTLSESEVASASLTHSANWVVLEFNSGVL